MKAGTMNTELPEAQEWLSPRTASKVYDIPAQTLARWRCEGTGPAYTKLGNAANSPIRYRRKDFEAWVTANLITHA
ncbi:helix-turn-helix domain-containing protein [Streptomyces microflavus]|uniref:helix-turn-helix domain-containing protein n=1 Tax=Streptomyces microflavus TaxID=1919 RepID=UPI003651C3C1